jgi:hypothetical protein
VIELPRITVLEAAESGLRRMMAVMVQSFGLVARGR